MAIASALGINPEKAMPVQHAEMTATV
jgi:hypothetical protein